jgi:hypothetical protein
MIHRLLTFCGFVSPDGRGVVECPAGRSPQQASDARKSSIAMNRTFGLIVAEPVAPAPFVKAILASTTKANELIRNSRSLISCHLSTDELSLLSDYSRRP